MKLKFKDANLAKRMIIFCVSMSILVLLVLFFIMKNGITNDETEKIDLLIERADLYSDNIKSEFENIVGGLQYVSSYLSEKYKENELNNENAISNLKILLNNNENAVAGFIYVPDSKLNLQDNEEKISNENLEIMVYKYDNSYRNMELTRISDSNDDNTNEKDRVYKINYANATITGKMQITRPIEMTYSNQMTLNVITVTVPIKVEGFVKGVVGVDLSYKDVANIFNKAIGTTKTDFSILNNDGIIIAGLNEDLYDSKYNDIYNKETVEFINEVLKSSKPLHKQVGRDVIVASPIISSGTHFFTLVLNYKTKDIYNINLGMIFLVGITVVILFVLFCLSIWYMVTKIINDKFNAMYKRFNENISEEFKENMKESFSEVTTKLDKGVEGIEKILDSRTVAERSEDELEKILEDAKGSLLNDENETTGTLDSNDILYSLTNTSNENVSDNTISEDNILTNDIESKPEIELETKVDTQSSNEIIETQEEITKEVAEPTVEVQEEQEDTKIITDDMKELLQEQGLEVPDLDNIKLPEKVEEKPSVEETEENVETNVEESIENEVENNITESTEDATVETKLEETPSIPENNLTEESMTITDDMKELLKEQGMELADSSDNVKELEKIEENKQKEASVEQVSSEENDSEEIPTITDDMKDLLNEFNGNIETNEENTQSSQSPFETGQDLETIVPQEDIEDLLGKINTPTE